MGRTEYGRNGTPKRGPALPGLAVVCLLYFLFLTRRLPTPITPPTKVDPPAGQINPMADINTGLSTFLEAPKPPTDHVFLAMEPAGARPWESNDRAR